MRSTLRPAGTVVTVAARGLPLKVAASPPRVTVAAGFSNASGVPKVTESIWTNSVAVPSTPPCCQPAPLPASTTSWMRLIRVSPTPLVASGSHAPLVPTLARVDQMPVSRSARSCSVTALVGEPTRFTAPKRSKGRRPSTFAVPVPTPGPVAVKMVPALLLAAPTDDQSVVPGVAMT